MGTSESNQFGHFEHTGFLEINEALLKYLGGSWDSPPTLQSDWEQDPGLDDLARKASALLKDFAACKHWGWKDPRTTILLPFWRRIVPNLRYVICIRNPLEVAWSLAQRDGQSITGAVHLWRQYTCQAIRSTEGYSRILTFYEDYFCRPTQEVNRLSEFCGLRNATGVSPIEASIAGELRHQVGRSRRAAQRTRHSPRGQVALFHASRATVTGSIGDAQRLHNWDKCPGWHG